MSYAESNVEPLRADIAPGWTDWSHNGTAFLGSLVIHALLLVVLALAPVLVRSAAPRVVMMAAAILEEPEQTLTIAEEFAPSDQQLPDIGANSDAGAATALATAPIVAEVSAVPNPVDIPIVSVGEIVVNNEIQLATGLRVENLAVRGHAGVGVTGAMGAIDRITKEILLSLEERRTLVVWFFDKSGSLNRQRQQVYDRFERIYQELGVIEAAGNPAFRRHADKPLLTSVVAFGQQVQFLIDKPTDNIAEIKAAVAEIEQDVSGLERTFSAVHSAAERYRKFRQDSPARNVLFIVFTDEVGNDQEGLDRTVNLCRRLEIPVYVVGTPAPFGQRTVQVKWVDPDPSYDQSPQWPEVDQGPESLFPEVVQLPFLGGDDPQPLDSGFGPYALTRLCYETSGMYFAVHPNRNTSRRLRQSEIDDYSAYFKHFFDPEVMRKYRPDYLAREEYLRQVGKSRLRSSLLRAAEVSDAGQLTTPN
ncbi:MAG: vWA domain-containing protein, partial [Pirellulaceae bacterium]